MSDIFANDIREIGEQLLHDHHACDKVAWVDIIDAVADYYDYLDTVEDEVEIERLAQRVDRWLINNG